jgi:hypothetical protein
MPAVNERDQRRGDSSPELKIVIVSTAKTGNTWLRHLLAAIYDLPAVDLGFPFDPDAASGFGERWITHQHYAPEPALLEWAQRNNAKLVTTIRHPGDVLVSLYHYVRAYNHQFDFHQLAAFAADDGTFGEPVRSVVQTVFADLIAVSVAWLSTGVAHVVQYEALYFDPVATLAQLTDAIHPVSRDCIERAVERCDIRVMRALAHENSAFFRQGGCGSWRRVLPADIIDLLRTTEPYPAQFAALGYTLDAQDAWSAASAKRPPAKAGFFDQSGYSPTTTSLLKSIYLSFDSSEAARRWPDIANTRALGAFHTWLNTASDADPHAPATPIVTNVAAYLHRTRTDVGAAFPDLYGQDRVDFVLWLLAHGSRDYDLDAVYVAPLRQSFVAWATQPDANDPARRASGAAASWDGVPVLTNLAAYVYQRRPDLRTAFPDLYGRNRLDVVLWMIEHAAGEYQLDQACTAPLRQEFLAWAIGAGPHSAAHTRRTSALPPSRARYQNHRFAYLSWYLLSRKQISGTPIGTVIRLIIWVLTRGWTRRGQRA